jgi:hypothetical protein
MLEEDRMPLSLISLSPSSQSDKKYVVKLKQDSGRTKSIHFGAKGMDDFTKTGDVAQKERYLKRHSAREHWNNPLTAGFWAKNILWNKPTVSASLEDTKRRYGL